MQRKRLIFILFLSFVGLNGMGYSFSLNFEKGSTRQTSKNDELLFNVKNNLASNDQEENTEYLNESYGFDLIFPRDKRSFQSFPVILLNITNQTIIQSNSYCSCISTNYPEVSINNIFDPENEADWNELMNNLENIWGSTNESIPIYLDFQITNYEISIFQFILIKDFTVPEFSFGFESIDSNNLIPYDNSMKFFNKLPIIFFKISDNIENIVDICLTVNNHIYIYPHLIKPFGMDPQLVNITLPEWEEMEEGLNTIPIYINDSAGNPSEVHWITINKDTIAPVFQSDRPNRAWLRIGVVDIGNYENPIYQKYEINENPIFNCQFSDTDIKSVQLFISLNEYKWDFDDVLHSQYMKFFNQTGSNILNLEAIQLNSTDWMIEFPDFIWENITNKDIEMSIELDDFAGNHAIFDLVIKNVSNKHSLIQTIDDSIIFISLGMLLFIIANISFIAYSIYSNKEKFSPLEEDLKNLDSELLDIVIQPIDQVKLLKIMKYCKNLNEPAKYEEVLPPDVQDIVKLPLQMLNIGEIRLLLSRYNMNSMQQEEFIREMIRLGPVERYNFLLDYMEQNENDDDDDDWEEIT